MDSRIPPLVIDAIGDTVDSAILFGISAADFKRLVAQAWSEALRKKRERDVEELLA
jgi:hypothetical protein